MIDVLIAEDSPVMQLLLKHILESDAGIRVAALAGDGQAAVEMAVRFKPDVIVMDINMPRLNGFQATRQIMETVPVPIILVSARWDPKEVVTTLNAMEAGALTVLEKPAGAADPLHGERSRELIRTVKLMSQVKVVGRRPMSPRSREPAKLEAPEIDKRPADIRVIAIGASTGGPPVLHRILAGLADGLGVPVLIVQHIAAGFLPGLTGWLSQVTRFPVHIAGQGEELQPGRAYFAPDDRHMGVSAAGRIVLDNGARENGLRPSIDRLFRSAAEVYGKSAVGVLLTGMGTDGAEGLKRMREKGAVTIAQDEKSATVFGMPARAVEIGAARYVLSPDEIIRRILTLARDGR